MAHSLSYNYQGLEPGKAGIKLLLSTESGVAAIEFAAVAPILILIMIGIMEVSMMKFGNAALENTLAQFTRAARIGCRDGEYASGDTSKCEESYAVDFNSLKESIRSNSMGFIKPDDNLCMNIYVNDTLLSNPSPGTIGEPGDVVIFEARYRWPLLSGYLQNIGLMRETVNFSTWSITRNEAFGVNVKRETEGMIPVCPSQ